MKPDLFDEDDDDPFLCDECQKLGCCKEAYPLGYAHLMYSQKDYETSYLYYKIAAKNPKLSKEAYSGIEACTFHMENYEETMLDLKKESNQQVELYPSNLILLEQ